MLNQSKLRDLFTYNEETGDLIWRQRQECDFADSDTCNRWNRRYANTRAGSKTPTGYTQIYINYRPYFAHKIIWMMTYGEWVTVDHIDHDRSNNRLSNLRAVTHAENCRNFSRKSNNTSGVNGVVWDKKNNKWRAQICVGGKAISLGRFPDKEKAIAARREADRKYNFHPNHGGVIR